MNNYTNNAALSIVYPASNRHTKAPNKASSFLSDDARNKRKIAKALREEARLLKQTALSVILFGFGCEAVLFYIGSFVKETLGVLGLIVIGICGVLCALGSLLLAAIMASTSYTLVDNAKQLLKEG